MALGENGFRAIFQLASAIVLSRLLAPEDFGIFAVMMVLHGLVAPLLGRAFSTALIQSFELQEQEASNFFWVAGGASALVGLALALSGPFLAQLFSDEVFVSLAPVFALLLWIDTIGAQYEALAKRSLRFDLILRAQFVALPISLIAGVLAAMSEFGVWALVVQTLLASLGGRILVAVFLGWKPKFYDRSISIKAMIQFGGKTGLGAFTRLLYGRLPLLFLASLGGAASAGQFNRGEVIFKRPLEQSVYPLASLFLPTMSAAARDPKRLAVLVEQSIWFLVLATAPLIIATAVFGDWMVWLLLGNQWTEAGLAVRWLAVLAIGTIAIRPVSALNAALGQPARGIGLKLALLPAFLASIFWAAPQGAVIVATTMALFSLAMLPLQLFVQLRKLSVPAWPIVREILLSVLLILFVGGGAFLLRDSWPNLIEPTNFELTDAVVLLALYSVCYCCVAAIAMCFTVPRQIMVTMVNKTLNLLSSRSKA
jgi:PST family polysaccharide transporter